MLDKNTIKSSLPNTWAKWAILFLVIAMLIGVYLRMTSFYNPISFNYRYLVHTHSHLVLLGWAFNAVATLIYFQYQDSLNPKKCKTLFILFQIALVGMMVSFPFQGYALFSILFSSMHILVSYFFVAHFLRATKSNINLSHKFIKLGFIFYLISTLGPLTLGPIVVMGHSHTAAYDLSIYFYLHFFYNGFFVFAILGIFLSSLGEIAEKAIVHKAFKYLGYAVIPTYVLSVFCYYTFDWLYVVGVLAAVLQLFGFYYLWSFLRVNKSLIRDIYEGRKIRFLYVGLVALGLKIALQLFSALPVSTSIICNTYPFVVAYLHLVFIGFITFSLLGLLFQFRLISTNAKNLHWGFIVLSVGFVFSELVIVLPVFGIFVSIFVYYLVFFFSAMMLVGAVILVRRT